MERRDQAGYRTDRSGLGTALTYLALFEVTIELAKSRTSLGLADRTTQRCAPTLLAEAIPYLTREKQSGENSTPLVPSILRD
jgi:hypothetical protein